jgi:hypothetical protein
MPIPLPNLDDRTYAELTAEARALIPNVLPAWTNHNPSDPGIVLVELLAWLTEMLLFQVNEIPEASTEAFLRLLNGRQWERAADASIDEAVTQTIRALRERYRAVTVEDFEHLIRHDWPSSPEAERLGEAAGIARVRAVARRNLTAADATVRADPAPAHVSVVVVPTSGERHPQPSPALIDALGAYLAPRRTLTTRLHVVGPGYADVGLAVTLAFHDDVRPDSAFAEVARSLQELFDPLTGGPDRTGWPFGRDVHASEVYATLEQVPVVDYVDEVRLTGATELDAHELVRLGTVDMTAYDRHGRQYVPTGAP